MTNRTTQKADTMARVRAAARKLYQERGYIGATSRDIAAEARMSTGAIFANWPGGLPELWTDVTGEPVPGSQPWSPKPTDPRQNAYPFATTGETGQ